MPAGIVKLPPPNNSPEPATLERSCAAVAELWPGVMSVASPNRSKLVAAMTAGPRANDNAARTREASELLRTFTGTSPYPAKGSYAKLITRQAGELLASHKTNLLRQAAREGS